jgi:hypothetical protein
LKATTPRARRPHRAVCSQTSTLFQFQNQVKGL